jgi:UDP-N-acetylmuramate--alanine ligase
MRGETVTRSAPAGPPAQLSRVHLVGVGGAGMSGIARCLLGRGCVVSGSEIKDSRALAVLKAAGVTIYKGQDPANIGDVDAVVVSTAIPADNVEVLEARRRGIPVLPRAAALAALMDGYQAVAVAGTHGKTTTTSMLTIALQHCGADPSFAIGGDLNQAGSNAHAGSGDYFVAEADESDGSFLLLSPTVAIITNVEADHLDFYATPADVTKAFEAFVDRVDPVGAVVLCADDPGALALVARAQERGVRTVLSGESEQADIRATGIVLAGAGSTSRLLVNGEPYGELTLRVPGLHNVWNALAAIAAGYFLGFDPAELAEGLATFTGARRRFELKGERAGVRVVDDYAHHPTEVAVTLQAARQAVLGQGRLVAVFQPHRFSRTAHFAAELGVALGLADEVVVMDVYSAGEAPLPGISGAAVADAVPLPPEHVLYQPSWTKVADDVVSRCRPGDLVLTMGAGDVTMVGPEILVRLGG